MNYMDYDVGHTGGKLRYIDVAKSKLNTSLLALLLGLRDREATDPRDKVYSVLGLYAGSSHIVPDYALSVKAVYIGAAKAIIHEMGDLSLLHLAGMQASKNYGHWTRTGSLPRMVKDVEEEDWHLPSWALDWGTISDMNPNASSMAEAKVPAIEMPSIHESFRCNVRWNGERIVASGIALARCGLKTDQGFDFHAFPRCSVTSSNFGSLHMLVSSTGSPPGKFDLADLSARLEDHDKGHVWWKSPKQVPPEFRDSGHQAVSVEGCPDGTRSRDWLVLLFGAKTPVILRPDYCRTATGPSGYTAVPSLDESLRQTPGPAGFSQLHGTFVLIGGVEKDMIRPEYYLPDGMSWVDILLGLAEGNPVPDKTIPSYVDFMNFNCIYADFEIG